MRKSLRYRMDAGRFGSFGVQGGYRHVLKMELAQFADAAPVDVMNDVHYLSFRTRSNWRLNWDIGSWSTSIYGYRYGTRPNYVRDGRVSPYTIWNADISLEVNERVRVGVSVLNFLDTLTA